MATLDMARVSNPDKKANQIPCRTVLGHNRVGVDEIGFDFFVDDYVLMKKQPDKYNAKIFTEMKRRLSMYTFTKSDKISILHFVMKP